ncbi:MAG TPA: DnaT-like ssDNA-binding protein [Burkholderiales bacterium]
MALTVEDGSGLASAESYLSVTDAKAYWTAHGLALGSATDAACEVALRNATIYIDSQWRFKGARLVAGQALEFPRSGLVDWSSAAITGIPRRLKDACAEAAFRALTENLFTDLDRGGQIKSETVGPLSVTYADGAPAGKTFTVVERLLAQYIRDPKRITGGPSFGGGVDGSIQVDTEDGYFRMDMQANPGAAPSDDGAA